MKIVSIQKLEDKIVLTAFDDNGDIFTEQVDPEVWEKISEVYEFYRKLENRQAKQYTRHLQIYEESITESLIAERLPNIADSVEDSFDVTAIKEAMEELTEIQQRRFRAFVFEGVTLEEIARREGASLSPVYRSIRQAIKKIRKIMNQGENEGV